MSLADFEADDEREGGSADDECDRCGTGLDGSSPVERAHGTRWHDRYSAVCGDCLQTDDVDPFAGSAGGSA
jgi:hypothetical protein